MAQVKAVLARALMSAQHVMSVVQQEKGVFMMPILIFPIVFLAVAATARELPVILAGYLAAAATVKPRQLQILANLDQ
ncbi:hypothetical protein A3D84_00530 [Candidatus Woesebacteria bacterium RIFCSPHIGHO2_02_FULL_42_20]|uniref:Uncharacterized protein n=1 Tax=Candidatus Woesebacteria bacterium RIFCSPHIGHO2_12_FULL_41_24 TaxID=1802510 RepID=A0A1F8AUI7_9BACT|nr:MAG: hypothetical protein A2W15_02035 [Candidatus Woesebacteria bacterium RBG_16_41_13]OGM29737.1 MAG: hypothetical protein A2873_02455 [Candidatus Woesebacteria bacterium RIFCSPHIGHO2_01_FULL_42_80]OGM35264.1 MAG: hypothetical protein A3D84_00530 [Candidatus Woesebacteria bacterium RIFCSPHIGHO2_02_FULL_42_20]OGM55159.1 MAG: hypothetical protein A3E44_04540 [Candidatus Woesebacteria bacterium RIFCSPHIGHO2_12_FULL_41_24]OGM67731.1 MAG: hypothetical protein A2969_02245 [Candidatus Woesebacteri